MINIFYRFILLCFISKFHQRRIRFLIFEDNFDQGIFLSFTIGFIASQ